MQVLRVGGAGELTAVVTVGEDPQKKETGWGGVPGGQAIEEARCGVDGCGGDADVMGGAKSAGR